MAVSCIALFHNTLYCASQVHGCARFTLMILMSSMPCVVQTLCNNDVTEAVRLFSETILQGA